MERCCNTYVSDQVHIRVSLSAERSCLRDVLELWTPIVLGDRPRMDRTVVKTLMISPSLCTKLPKLEHFMHSVHSKLANLASRLDGQFHSELWPHWRPHFGSAHPPISPIHGSSVLVFTITASVAVTLGPPRVVHVMLEA